MKPLAAARALVAEVERLPEVCHYARVSAVLGMLIEIEGGDRELAVGSRCRLVARHDRRVPCDVVGFRAGRALAMAFGRLDGVDLPGLIPDQVVGHRRVVPRFALARAIAITCSARCTASFDRSL